MSKTTFKTMTMGILAVAAAVSFSGCGIPVTLAGQSLNLVGEIEVPRMDLPMDEIPEEWLDFIEAGDYEYQQAGEYCDLPDLGRIQELAGETIPSCLAGRIRVRSVTVTSVDFIAVEGDFSAVTKLDTDLLIGDDTYRFRAESPTGFGQEVSLSPDPPLDLAEVINADDIDCLGYEVHIKGSLPDEDLVFEVVVNFDIVFLIRII